MFDFFHYTGILGIGLLQQGHKRVLRGGSWINNGRNLRSANRNANTPDNRNHNYGLRLAGALLAGGSINQRHCQIRVAWQHAIGQTLGLRRVSRCHTQSLPSGRLIHAEPR